jgi:hypothetical protein
MREATARPSVAFGLAVPVLGAHQLPDLFLDLIGLRETVDFQL